MTEKPRSSRFVHPDDITNSVKRSPLKRSSDWAARSISVSTTALSKSGILANPQSTQFQVRPEYQQSERADSKDLSLFVFPENIPAKSKKIGRQVKAPLTVKHREIEEKQPNVSERIIEAPTTSDAQSQIAPSRDFDWLTDRLLRLLISEAVPLQKLYLLVTPIWLSRALSDESCCFDATQAEQIAKEIVSSRYKDLCIDSKEGLEKFLLFDDRGLPECLPLLALSVLACYHMQGDARRGALAYYDRLAALLEIGITSQSLPERFEGQKFEHLWFHFGNWLLEHHGIELALPEVKIGARKYIAYPLKHVALRQVDISKLPLFFDWADLQAGQQPSELQLGLKIDRWAQVSQKLSSNGKDSLNDERREAVLLQVASELKHWDGSVSESSSSSSSISVTKSRIEIFLDWEGVRPRLYWCPRRPSTYPLIWSDQNNVLDSNDGDCWYETTPLNLQDGEPLLKGFHWEMRDNSRMYRLSRPPSTCVCFAPSPQMNGNKLSRNSLPFGLESSVLVHESVLPVVLEYLKEITNAEIKARSYSSLPEGWLLIRSVVPVHEVMPPEELDCLRVDSDIEITLSSGLKLGREYKWLRGSPPVIYVSGDCVRDITFDMKPAELRQGKLEIPDHQFSLGVHTVQAGKRRISFEILDASLDHDVQSSYADSLLRPVCLPGYYRAVIGANPGEIKQFAYSSKNGNIFLVPFEPVWAFSPTLKKVFCLQNKSVALFQRHKRTLPIDKASLDWARTIYEHCCHKGKLACHDGLDSSVVRNLWNGFCEAAKKIKKTAKVHK